MASYQFTHMGISEIPPPVDVEPGSVEALAGSTSAETRAEYARWGGSPSVPDDLIAVLASAPPRSFKNRYGFPVS